MVGSYKLVAVSFGSAIACLEDVKTNTPLCTNTQYSEEGEIEEDLSKG